MNESSNHMCAVICCNRKGIIHPQPKCGWNVSFLAKEMMLPDSHCSNVIPNRWLEILDGIISRCSESKDSDLENDFFNLMKFGMNRVDTSINDRLIQRLGAEDYKCSTLLIIANGTKNVLSTCGASFDFDFSSIKELDCVKTASDSENENLYYNIMIGLSLPFLAATFLIYTILPELRNLHGLILRSYVACAFIDHSLLLIPNTEFNPTSAGVMAIFEFFSAMATFTWLNVMCFDIWWTFRSLQNSSRQGTRKRFIIYSIYAWGIPTLMTGLFAYNSRSGWVSADVDFVIYLGVPIAVTIFFNLCFFVLTVAKIIQQQKDPSQHLEGSENRRRNDEKQRFNVYLKLFIVMGIVWVVDMVITFINLPKCGWVRYILYILQLPSLLQGLFVFIIFVCTANIKRLLSKRLRGKVTLSRRTTQESQESPQ